MSDEHKFFEFVGVREKIDGRTYIFHLSAHKLIFELPPRDRRVAEVKTQREISRTEVSADFRCHMPSTRRRKPVTENHRGVVLFRNMHKPAQRESSLIFK